METLSSSTPETHAEEGGKNGEQKQEQESTGSPSSSSYQLPDTTVDGPGEVGDENQQGRGEAESDERADGKEERAAFDVSGYHFNEEGHLVDAVSHIYIPIP